MMQLFHNPEVEELLKLHERVISFKLKHFFLDETLTFQLYNVKTILGWGFAYICTPFAFSCIIPTYFLACHPYIFLHF